MKKTKNEEKTVYYWRALSNRIGWIGIIILLIGLFVSMAFREVIYLLIIGGVGFLCFVASSILYYEMWRCPNVIGNYLKQVWVLEISMFVHIADINLELLMKR